MKIKSNWQLGLLLLLGLLSLIWLLVQAQDGRPSVKEETLSSARATSDHDYEVIEQAVYKGETRLYGQLYRPKTTQSVPLAIFSHELGNTHASGEAYASYLASRGIATYLFDFSGGSASSQSDGATKDMSVLTEVADLEAVLADAQSWHGIDRQRIVLLGASQGGVVSALTAARHKEEIAGLILLYPAFVIQDEIHRQFASKDQIPDEFSYLGWFSTGKRYATDIWDMDFYQEIQGFDKKVLLLHGDRDGLVDASYSQKAEETYAKARLEMIEGSGHSFLDAQFDQVAQFIDEYIQKLQEEPSTVSQETIKLHIQDQIISLSLEDNETSKALVKRLPLTVTLEDVNQNEKYTVLNQALPTNPVNPREIHTGDVMLYGDSGLVLFYEDFATSYSYTPIGRIDNAANLKALVGEGSVTIRMEAGS